MPCGLAHPQRFYTVLHLPSKFLPTAGEWTKEGYLIKPGAKASKPGPYPQGGGRSGERHAYNRTLMAERTGLDVRNVDNRVFIIRNTLILQAYLCYLTV